MGEPLELSVGIATFHRAPILDRCLAQLAPQCSGRRIEVLVCDSAGDDRPTRAVVDKHAAAGLPVRLVEPRIVDNVASAWNACLEAAGAELILFLCDDGLAGEGLLERHIAFHRAGAAGRRALQGRIVEAESARPTPFMRWTEASGIRFGSPAASSGSVAPWLFRFMNASISKRELAAIGGCDVHFRLGGDDIDTGMRLAAAGVGLAYDREAVVEHLHPTDLPATLGKLRTYGAAGRELRERWPQYPQPRRPALRHRAWAQALTGLQLARIRPRAVREETWRFLCTQALREGLWSGADSDSQPRVGARLARIAATDPEAAWPA